KTFMNQFINECSSMPAEISENLRPKSVKDKIAITLSRLQKRKKKTEEFKVESSIPIGTGYEYEPLAIIDCIVVATVKLKTSEQTKISKWLAALVEKYITNIRQFQGRDIIAARFLFIEAFLYFSQQGFHTEYLLFYNEAKKVMKPKLLWDQL